MSKSYDEFKNDQDQLLSEYETVKQEILQIPNVLAVGIGLKETQGDITEEVTYRVFVAEKKPLNDLRPEQIIPSQIHGFRTDVLTVYRPQERAFVEKRDKSNYRPIKGGIALANEKSSPAYGTLGWFAKLADNTQVILTNKHVLYDSSQATNNTKVKTAQPIYEKSCCCECGVVGETIIGIKNNTVDCAIAKINADINRQLLISNNSSAETLQVAATTTAAVVGTRVRKIGARSGFTKGTVVHIGDAAAAPTDPGGTALVVMPNQVLIVPTNDETYEIENGKKAFSNSGDSGSVILNDSNQIVALLWGGDKSTNSYDVTWANNINNVLTALSGAGFAITLESSPASVVERSSSIVVPVSKPEKKPSPVTVQELLSLNPELLQDTPTHHMLRLFYHHRNEVVSLINHRRPVKLVWHRNQGPAFAAHFLNSAKDPLYQFPQEVKGVAFQTLLTQMAAILTQEGSETLRSDIATHSDTLIRLSKDCDNVHRLLEKMLESENTAYSQVV